MKKKDTKEKPEQEDIHGSLNLLILILLIIASFLCGAFVTNLSYSKFLATTQKKPGDSTQPLSAQVNQQQAITPTETETQNIASYSATIPSILAEDHKIGSASAQAALIVYSDFECQYCKSFFPTIMQAVKDYNGKILLIYRHFPLNFHENSPKEAEASECANELGGNSMFWEYASNLFDRTTSNGTGFSLDNLVPLAKELGLDADKFSACLNSGKYAEFVQNQRDGGTGAGVNGTPSTIVTNLASGESQLVIGDVSYETLKTKIKDVVPAIN